MVIHTLFSLTVSFASRLSLSHNIACVYRHAAELNVGLGQSPTQQAIVQTFLKNYDQVMTDKTGLSLTVMTQTIVHQKPLPDFYTLSNKC